MDDALSGLAPYFLHVSYVVRDVFAAQEWFKRIMGVKHFGATEMTVSTSFLMRGKPIVQPFSIKLAIGRVGPEGKQEIELIAPSSPHDNIYQEFIDTAGPGLHHMAFCVPDWDAATQELRAAGVPRIFEGHNRDFHFAYFDLRAATGSFIEVVQYDTATNDFVEKLKGSAK